MTYQLTKRSPEEEKIWKDFKEVWKVDWSKIMTAREASLKLGKNEKYVYFLWKNNSDALLENSVSMKGNTLLISKDGYEHLKRQIKDGSNYFSTSKGKVRLNEIYA